MNYVNPERLGFDNIDFETMDEQNLPSASKLSKEYSSSVESFRQGRSNSFSLKQNRVDNQTPANNVFKRESSYETPKRPKMSDSFNESLNNTSVDVPPSPWEWRKMKGEIISLKARLKDLESTNEQLHKVRREIEEVFQKEKKSLEIQIEQDKQMKKQLELRIEIGRKNQQEAKAAQQQAEQNFMKMKNQMEEKIVSLVADNTKLTEELRFYIKQEKASKDESNVKTTTTESKSYEEIIEKANKRIAELEEKLKDSRIIQQKYELQCVEVQNLKIKIVNLESDRAMWEEGKQFMHRAAKANEYEKELKKAGELIATLRQSVKGKLLLEEQMATMQQRVERMESLEKQITELEVNLGELRAKISDYESLGIPGGPSAMRREISRLQRAEMMLTAEDGQLRSELNSVKRELASCQQQLEEAKKMFADTTNSHERLTRFASRMQKKLSLVTRERDSYRQQLDTYEKEITAYQSNETPTSIVNERIPALERTVEGYRELVAKLESDLEAVDGKSQKEEMKKLKEENDRLKGELEHRALKGDFNINTRILHYKFNPAALAEQQAEEKQNALLREVEQLRAMVASGNSSGSVPVSTFQAQEIAELQQKNELKITRLKEAFKASSHEYRQACYQLFGWRVDRTKEGQYKLSSQYAESPDDYLFFIVNDEGVNMIETPFSATLATFIERHLVRQHSVPMFLNAVQSDLFDQQTATNVIN